MSKRLQVVMSDGDLRRIRALARAQKTTVSELTRRALADLSKQEARGDVEAKLAVVRRAAKHAFPTGDVEQLNAEIERGYKL